MVHGGDAAGGNFLIQFIDGDIHRKKGVGAGYCSPSESMQIIIKSGTINCRITDDGKPVANLVVLAEAYHDDGKQAEHWWMETQKTDAEGRAIFPAFPEGNATVLNGLCPFRASVFPLERVGCIILSAAL